MIDKRLNIVWAVRRKDKHNRFRLTSGLREIVRQIYFKISSRLNVSFICQINFTPSFLLAIDTPLLTRLHTKERLMIP